jgi:hypothetical protein
MTNCKKQIYRLRPLAESTLTELKEPYLWFSKPTAFKDVEDANISMFVEHNGIVKDALSQVFSENQIQELTDRMRHIGICCFTTHMPNREEKNQFPKGYRSMVIEFDKECLSEYFLNSQYAIANCFYPIKYTDNPIKVEQDGNYHYLYDKGDWGEHYKSIKELAIHPRYVDRFIFFLLTRLNERFSIQKEERIILSGHNIKEFDDNVAGYKIQIPRKCIRKIYFYDGDSPYVEKVRNLGYETEIIQ